MWNVCIIEFIHHYFILTNRVNLVHTKETEYFSRLIDCVSVAVRFNQGQSVLGGGCTDDVGGWSGAKAFDTVSCILFDLIWALIYDA